VLTVEHGTGGVTIAGNGSIHESTGFVCNGVVAVEEPRGVPNALSFEVPFPTPSRGVVTFAFTLPAQSDVRLEIYDLGGRLVARPHSGVLPAGSHALAWNPHNMRAGVYLVRLVTPGAVRTQRVLRVP
jgi:hypothetical protein